MNIEIRMILYPNRMLAKNQKSFREMNINGEGVLTSVKA